ncbi:MAG: choice-of-anchor Q domain-containing protein [Chloroflexota bacterium]
MFVYSRHPLTSPVIKLISTLVLAGSLIIPLFLLLTASLPVARAATGYAVGETGQVPLLANGSATTVMLNHTYNNPVVVAYIHSRNQPFSVDVRVQNVTASSFDVRLQTPAPTLPGGETIAYIVMEAGHYNLAGGLTVEAGTVETDVVHHAPDSHAGVVVDFAVPFANPPVLLHTLNSNNAADFISTAAHNITTTDFQVTQEAGKTGNTAVSETIGWIAFSTGAGASHRATFSIGSANDGTNDGVDNTPHTINYNSFTATPDIVVKGNSSNGTDGFWARGASIHNATTHTVYAEEDDDGEQSHGDETFGWAAFSNDATLHASVTSQGEGYNSATYSFSVAAPGVLANDAHFLGYGVTAVLAAPPQSGSVTLNPDGSFDYIAGSAAEDSFTYFAQRGSHISTDPIAYWTFEDEGNSETADSSGNGNHLSVSGSVSYQTRRPDNLISSASVLFNTDSDQGTLSGINLRDKPFTVALWAKRTATGGEHFAITHDTLPIANQHLTIGFNSLDWFVCGFRTNNLHYTVAQTDTEWHHWACTYNPTTNERIIYKDGVAVANDIASADYQGVGTLFLGHNFLTGDSFRGNLDDVRLYEATLTAVDIKTLADNDLYATSPVTTVTITMPPNCYARLDSLDQTFTSIDGHAVQAAVDAASSGDLIKIAGTCAGVEEQSGVTQTVYINNSVTLQGGYSHTNWAAPSDPDAHPTILDAQNNGRVIYMPNANNTVTLDGLTIQNGHAPLDGGGVRAQDNLTIINSIIRDNYATRYGGGINISANGVLHISNSLIANNRADGNFGGGIASAQSQITIEYTEIYSNYSSSNGGGIDLLNDTAVIRHSTLHGNTATGQGSAINGDKSDVTIENSTVTNNFANTSNTIRVRTSNDPISSTLILSHTTVANNTGNGVRIVGNATTPGTPEAGRAFLYSSLIANNSGVDCGTSGNSVLLDASGGYNVDSDGTCIVGGGTGNITADSLLEPLADNGGATPTMALPEGSPAMDRVPVGTNGCGTTYATDQRGTLRPQNAQCDSGAYEVVPTPRCFVEITGDNSTDFASGDASAVQQGVDAVVDDGLVKVAGTCAGVQVRDSLTQTVNIAKSLTLQGGYDNGSWTASPDPTLHPTTLDAANGGRVINIKAGGYHVTVDGLIIENGNTIDFSSPNGAGIFAAGTLTLTNSIVRDNQSGNYGGGIYVRSNSTAYIGDSTITNNRADFAATGFGGGIHSNIAYVTLNNTAIFSNTADVGAGMTFVRRSINIENSAIHGNIATTQAGAIHSQGATLSMVNSTVSGNHANSAGGILNLRATAGFTATLTLTNTTVANNTGNHGIRTRDNLAALARSTAPLLTVEVPDDANRAAHEANIASQSQASSGAQTFLYNSIIANNANSDCITVGGSADLDVSGGYNVDSDGSCVTAGVANNITADPLLEPLANNGGATPTHALQAESPAGNRVPFGVNGCGATITTDQRGVARDLECDSGAYEAVATRLCYVEATGDNVTDYSSVSAIAVQIAADNASADDVLRIAGSCAGVQVRNDITQTVYIDKNLTLSGGYDHTDWSAPADPDLNPTTLDANSLGRVVVATGSSDVVLENLTLTNGITTGNDFGAGIRSDANSLTVSNSIITDNIATRGGGGFDLRGGSAVLIEDSLISNNQATSGSWGYGGGIHISGAMVTIRNSTIDSNSGKFGAGVANWSGNGLLIENSTVSNNIVIHGGGGGGIFNRNSVLTVNNSTITGNGRHGISNWQHGDDGATLFLTHSTVTNNGRNGLWQYVDNPTQPDNTSATIRNSIIANNGTGGSHDDCRLDWGTFDITGGYNLDSDGSCFTNGVDNNLTADPLLDALADNGGDTLTQALLAGSPAYDAIPNGVNGCGTTTTIDQRGATRPQNDGCDIGAFEAEPFHFCFVEITGDGVTDFSSVDSSAVQAGVDAVAVDGTVKVAGTCIGTQPGTDFPQTVYIDKNLTLQGGYDPDNWLADPSARTQPTILDADETGRVVKIADAATVTLSRLTIMGGTISGSSVRGGGIHNAGTLTLEYSMIDDNDSAGAGGLFNSGTATVRQSTFRNNSATTGSGGGLYNGSEGTLTVSNSTLSGNTAVWNGSALINRGGDATLVNNTIVNNDANAAGTTTGTGALYNSLDGLMALSNNIIIGNTINGDLTASNTNCQPASPITDSGYNVVGTSSGCSLSSGTTIAVDQTAWESVVASSLADNGGETLTYALAANSPAADLIPSGVSACATPMTTITTDQRGLYARPQNGRCDAGSFENWSVDVDISGTNLLFTWDNTGTCTIDLYESTTPYFTPTTVTYPNQSSGALIPQLGDPATNYFYIARMMCDGVAVGDSNEVGEFDFAIVGGE